MSVFGFSDLAFLGAAGGVASYDPDAQAYITAVEAADGQALETAVRDAINAFVVGCKADGIWSAIKASCILAGARTLNGALVPLVGSAPTNFNFVAGDYNRKTGLVGNGSTKYLNSNRANSADPQNNAHFAFWLTDKGAAIQNRRIMQAGTFSSSGMSHATFGASASQIQVSLQRGSTNELFTFPDAPCFVGLSRSTSNSFDFRSGGVSTSRTSASTVPAGANWLVFNGETGSSNVRLAFYSIGEALDLALLDARVTTLINAFAAAIP